MVQPTVAEKSKSDQKRLWHKKAGTASIRLAFPLDPDPIDVY